MRIRIVALTGVLAASTLVSAPAMAHTAPAPGVPAATGAAWRNTCNPEVATLPPAVEGRPALAPGGLNPGVKLGLYVWHEARGWRVRLTHDLRQADAVRPQLIEVRGRITASRPIRGIRTVRLEGKQHAEWVSIQRPRRKVMDFRFVNGGFIDGINFTAGCAGRLTFTAWQVVRDPVTGAVVRTPLDVYVGAAMSPVTQAVPANPGLVSTDQGARRVVITRAAPSS